MTRAAAGSPIWTGTWDASATAAGLHTLEVQAAGTTTRSHVISVTVEAGTNRAPVAANDSYDVTKDTPLSVASPGVLSNDSDADGDALSAQLVTPPAHGVLDLAATGAFTYTPATGFTGGDTFTYVATTERWPRRSPPWRSAWWLLRTTR